MSDQSQTGPVCGCGKPWPTAAIQMGAQCIACGESSPPPAATPPRPTEGDLLREAETHLWAMLVWFGGERTGNPYADRDIATAEAWLGSRGLTADEMTRRHRALTEAADR